ncbi:MAG: BamA/TamA family outer membrane protein [Bacteroidaceae bacterium]|nr:BamA/TamA family outer membrane protein [Bacteroidaceae bacterium]
MSKDTEGYLKTQHVIIANITRVICKHNTCHFRLRHASFSGIACLLFCLLVSACSITSSLPEGEKLYRGIKSIDYDSKPRTSDNGVQEGVITALADAYTTVEGLLTGDATVLKSENMSEKAVRDSMKRASEKDKMAYESAKEEVEAVLSYAPNGALMGSSFVTHPFPIKLLIYNKYAGSKHRFGKWMFNHFAASPVLISNVNPRLRATVAKNTLRSRGYFRAQTGFETLPDPRDTLKERVRYNIHPGPVYHLDSIAYVNFPKQADSIIRNIAEPTALHRGDPFSVVNLEAERTRIVSALREQGYYYQRNEHINFRADTLQTPMLVKLQVQPSPTTPPEAMRPYYIGNTRVNIYKYGDRQIVDTLAMRGGYSFGYSQPLTRKEGATSPLKGVKGFLLRPRAVWRSMLFRKGDLYKQSLGELMQEGLASTNVFSSLRINYVPRSAEQDSMVNGQWPMASDTLDIVVNATLDKPYDAEFQGNLTGKTGGQVGPGASFSFSKRNAFRAAETLTLKVWGSYEWQTGANISGKRSLLNSYEYGLSGSLSYPRFRFFGSIGRKLGRKFVSTTAIDLQARWQNRAGFFGRVSWSAGVNYTLQHKRNIKHEFSPLTISYDQLLHSTERFDSIVKANPALYVSMRDQFVPSMSYSFSWAGTPKHPSALTVSFKEASALLSSIYAIAGKPYSEEGKRLLDVPFAQFVKGTVQYTRQFPLTKRSIIATRAFAGVVYSYGNAKAAPYSELFSVGGANSIRAFGMRTIGPGAYHPERSQYSYVDQMGDFKLELNAEYRFPIVGKLNGAAFLDAGNVWLLRESESQPGGKFHFKDLGREIALGTGVGIRYDLDFLVIRFDLGIGIHAPYDTGKRGYYNMPSFGKSLGYHFAIGYPF